MQEMVADLKADSRRFQEENLRLKETGALDYPPESKSTQPPEIPPQHQNQAESKDTPSVDLHIGGFEEHWISPPKSPGNSGTSRVLNHIHADEDDTVTRREDVVDVAMNPVPESTLKESECDLFQAIESPYSALSGSYSPTPSWDSPSDVEDDVDLIQNWQTRAAKIMSCVKLALTTSLMQEAYELALYETPRPSEHASETSFPSSSSNRSDSQAKGNLSKSQQGKRCREEQECSPSGDDGDNDTHKRRKSKPNSEKRRYA